MEIIRTVTQEGYNKMVEELHYLKTTKREEITEAIRVALSFGDLSENSEYDEAKAEQGKVETRINELEEILKNIKIISADDISTDSVGVGTKVRVFNRTKGIEVTYSLVGFGETDPFLGRISDQSPIGKAINHKSVGDVVTVEVPAGVFEIEILSIERDSN